MACVRDNLHYTFRKIDGYNLPFNFVISEREPGKSTAANLDKIYKDWKEHRYQSVIVKRQVNHITDSYIDDIGKCINKFTDDNVVLEYKHSELQQGIVNVRIKGEDFCRIVALSVKMSALKSLIVLNLKYMLFDEFICNPKWDEKYLKDEASRFMEIYNTYKREAVDGRLKCYFLGNPYSLYNPYFMFFDVDTAKLKRGAIVTDGKRYVIECYEMNPLLKAKILKENPLAEMDNSYARYAFDGLNVNDANITIRKVVPDHYPMRFVFRVQGKCIAVHSANWIHVDINEAEFAYYARFIDPSSVSKRRDIICFDFDELVENTALLSSEDRNMFSKLKRAIQRRDIAFSSIECYYLLEEVYFNL